MSNAGIFRALHHQPDQALILPNVRDVGGAKLVESLGAKAIATTSAGVAWSLGWPDGNRLPMQEQVRLATNIVRAVGVPVSIDIEAGYSDDPSAVGENLRGILDAGVAGINIEDGTDQPALLAKKIETIRNIASSMNVDVFINARTDVFLQNLTPDEKKIKETLARASVYCAAGADGLFVPALAEPSQIGEITAGTELPVNVLAWPGLPKVSDLATLGVRRLSAGSGIPQIIWQHVAKLTQAFLAEGNSELFARDYMGHGQLQALFAHANQGREAYESGL